MDKSTIVCTICPIGCCINIVSDAEKIISVEGNSCSRGETYARAEFACPVRTLTTSVTITGSDEPLLPVRSEQPIPKAELLDCMKQIKTISVKAPVSMHQVILDDLNGTGVALIATCSRSIV